MKYFILPLLLLVSCSTKPNLEVESLYWSRRDLASSVVNTPDPEKQSLMFGQRVVISWSVSKKDFNSGPLALFIRIKLKNNEEIDQRVPLDKPSGIFYVPIYGNDFTKKGGLQSYSVQLLSGDKLLATRKHKLWVEPIRMANSDSE
ncbi:MAG: hypothetical protein JSR46_09080 [Verrucomicrobia bacterium]|nr:hypothetical protein [Verrucomicrobiota bacterium]